jgi:hypothetical protein
MLWVKILDLSLTEAVPCMRYSFSMSQFLLLQNGPDNSMQCIGFVGLNKGPVKLLDQCLLHKQPLNLKCMN